MSGQRFEEAHRQVALSPPDRWGLFLVGLSLFLLLSYPWVEGRLFPGERERRIGELRALVARRPGELSLWRELGALLLEAGRVRQAVDALEEAVRRDPRDAASHHLLGLALWRLGRKGEAEAHLRRAVEADPRSGLYHYSLGLLLIEEEHPAEAVPVLEEGERLSSSPELSRALAQAYEALGEREKAREAFGRAAERERRLREESLRGRTVVH